MAPYPSHQEITAMFKNFGEGAGSLRNHLHPNVKVQVMGHDHEHAGHFHGTEAIAKDSLGAYDWLDWGSMRNEIRSVIGGGESAWACVEVESRGRGRKGKEFHYDWVFIAHFDTEGKIVEGRVYVDSAHAHDHRRHHEEN